MNIATLPIKGTRVIVKDAMIMLDEKAESPEWPHVVVAPGEYAVSILANNGETSGVRMCRTGVATPKRGKEIGRVSVDNAAVAICDYDALLAAVKADLEAYSDWTEDDCGTAVWEQESGVLEFSGVPIAHLKTGIGDGTFPVWELVEDGRVVGMECLFEIDAHQRPPLVSVSSLPDDRTPDSLPVATTRITTMGLLADIYVAHDDEAASYDTTPDQFTERARYNGFTTLQFSILWSIMRGVEWEVDILAEFPRLPQVNGKRQIHRLPAAMTAELAALSADRVASVSSAWAATEEMGWPPEAAREVLGNVVYLARRATETGRSLHLWNCI